MYMIESLLSKIDYDILYDKRRVKYGGLCDMLSIFTFPLRVFK